MYFFHKTFPTKKVPYRAILVEQMGRFVEVTEK